MSWRSFTKCCSVKTSTNQFHSKLIARKIKEFLEKEGYDVRINEPWTGAIMDVVKDANDKDLVGIGFEFRQDLLQSKEWMDKLCVDVTAAFSSLALE